MMRMNGKRCWGEKKSLEEGREVLESQERTEKELKLKGFFF